MFFWRSCLLALPVVAAGVTPLSAQVVHWSAASGGNGHWYEAVYVPAGIDWASADVAARVAGGHLASVSDAAENDFVFGLVDDPRFWFPDRYNSNIGPWLGGVQPSGSPEPAGGWEWVTGEPFTWTSWAAGEPNNLGGNEDRLHFFYNPAPTRMPHWNDLPGFVATIVGYVVEYELTLDPAVPGVAGQWNSLQVRWASPGEMVYLVGGLGPGSTAVPGCPGLYVDIANPVVGGAEVADARGNATFSVFLPAKLAGQQAYGQAVEIATCRVSNLLVQSF